MLIDLIVIIIVLILSAIFSGAETAFITSDRLELSISSKEHSYYNKTFNLFHSNSSRFLASIIIGNTITLVVFGIFFDQLINFTVEQYFNNFNNQSILFTFKAILGSVIVLVISEFTPKSLSRFNPTFFLKFFTPILHLTYLLLWPFVWICLFFSHNLLRLIFKEEYKSDEKFLGLANLSSYLRKRINTDETHNIHNKARFIANALDFNETRVRDILVPRTEIKSIDVIASIQELTNAFIESGHSKILVYEKEKDNIIGYCHSMHLFEKPKNIRNILTKISIYPEIALAKEVMVELLKIRKSLALVVDEYGSVSGIVTIEDIIEEILGEIHDEHDEDELIEKQLDDKTYILSARHEIDYLNDKYHWKLPTGDYETLGGLIIDMEGNIPEIGHEIIVSSYSIEILIREDTRIKTVKLKILQSIDE